MFQPLLSSSSLSLPLSLSLIPKRRRRKTTTTTTQTTSHTILTTTTFRKILLLSATSSLLLLNKKGWHCQTRILPHESSGTSGVVTPFFQELLSDSPLSATSSRRTISTALRYRGGSSSSSSTTVLAKGEVVSALVDDVYTWCINLGQPSTLIAGAVIVTIYENIGNNGNLDILPQDSKWTKFQKRWTISLLISAFGLEIIAIYVTTVTGTMLLSRPIHEEMEYVQSVTIHTTPLEFLRNNFEFEYLTARIAYLQGLLNWLAAIAMSHIIPRRKDDNNNERMKEETKHMNRFISNALFCIIALLLAFYNKHMTFYNNYIGMLYQWIYVTNHRFFLCWPPRPMAIVYIPAILSTLFWGFKAFFG